MRGSCLMTSITTLCILSVALGQTQVGGAAGITRECVPLGGTRCGGFAGFPCCQHPHGPTRCQTPPNTADAFGTCVIDNGGADGIPKECEPLGGTRCGGFAGFPCCRYTQFPTRCQTPPNTADAFGTCVIDNGGAAGIPKECEQLGGKRCGGLIGTPCCRQPQVPFPIRCQTPPGTADAFGTCVIDTPTAQHHEQ